MTKFIYNPSDLYTLLFKGGSVEIKPKKYIPVEDKQAEAGGVFADAIRSGQVKAFDSEADIPNDLTVAEKLVVITKTPVTEGLTEDQMKAETATKKTSEREPATVDSIGVDTSLVTSTPSTTTIGEAPQEEPVKAEVETPEAEVEAKPKAKRGPKAKTEPEDPVT